MTADHYYNKYGGDMVRLWAASVDYQNDVPFSEELFQQTGESYRRIRNTFRVLLGNLHDAPEDVRCSRFSVSDFTLIDRWILERLHAVTTDCLAGYAAYDFRKVVSTITQFVSGDLSALYIDITKDRLYCDAANSPRRRATQAAIREVTETLVKLLAPILAYTADETWEFLGHTDSVHLQPFPDVRCSRFSVSGSDDSVIPAVEDLLKARAVIQQAIEAARQAKQIGSNLEATPRSASAIPSSPMCPRCRNSSSSATSTSPAAPPSPPPSKSVPTPNANAAGASSPTSAPTPLTRRSADGVWRR
jgi:isoleucyl-tRNA synthetase